MQTNESLVRTQRKRAAFYHGRRAHHTIQNLSPNITFPKLDLLPNAVCRISSPMPYAGYLTTLFIGWGDHVPFQSQSAGIIKDKKKFLLVNLSDLI